MRFLKQFMISAALSTAMLLIGIAGFSMSEISTAPPQILFTVSSFNTAPSDTPEPQSYPGMLRTAFPASPLTAISQRRNPESVNCRMLRSGTAALPVAELLLLPHIIPENSRLEYRKEFYSFLRRALPPRAGPQIS